MLTEVQVTANAAEEDGGGIVTAQPNGKIVTITGSTVSHNTAGREKGLSNEAVGGGILALGAMTLTDSWVHDNSAANPEHAPGGGGGGIYYGPEAVNETLVISGSTIGPNNQATDGDGIELSKGLFGGTADLTRSTIVENTRGKKRGRVAGSTSARKCSPTCAMSRSLVTTPASWPTGAPCTPKAAARPRSRTP